MRVPILKIFSGGAASTCRSFVLPRSPQSDLNQRPTLYKSVALPLSYKGKHYTYPYARSSSTTRAFKPDILTVCNGVGQGSSLNIQRGLIPNLQDSDGPVAEWHLWLGHLNSLMRVGGLEPPRVTNSTDFKSGASTDSATLAKRSGINFFPEFFFDLF